MGFGRTARGRSFVYHAGTVVDSVGGTCRKMSLNSALGLLMYSCRFCS